MSISMDWHNAQKTILRSDIRGEWSWEEFHESITRSHDMLRAVNHPVVVINVRHAGSKTPKGSAFSHLSRAAKQMPANQILTINVSSDRNMMRMISSVMTRMFPFMPQKFRIVGSMDEAMELAQKALSGKLL